MNGILILIPVALGLGLFAVIMDVEQNILHLWCTHPARSPATAAPISIASSIARPLSPRNGQRCFTQQYDTGLS
jgi:hypothetical protein